MTHLTFEEISDLADSGEAPRDPHLTQCAECRETLRRVRELVTVAHHLPRDVVAPADVWRDLRDRMASERRGARRSRLLLRVMGYVTAIAAGIALVAIVLPSRSGKAKAKARTSTPVTVIVSPAVATVEKNYAGAIVELRTTLDAQRDRLSPGTLRVLSHSLAVIDTAIAEARAALAADPANADLRAILSAQYEQKVDLLQRATRLSPST